MRFVVDDVVLRIQLTIDSSQFNQNASRNLIFFLWIIPRRLPTWSVVTTKPIGLHAANTIAQQSCNYPSWSLDCAAFTCAAQSAKLVQFCTSRPVCSRNVMQRSRRWCRCDTCIPASHCYVTGYQRVRIGWLRLLPIKGAYTFPKALTSLLDGICYYLQTFVSSLAQVEYCWRKGHYCFMRSIDFTAQRRCVPLGSSPRA